MTYNTISAVGVPTNGLAFNKMLLVGTPTTVRGSKKKLKRKDLTYNIKSAVGVPINGLAFNKMLLVGTPTTVKNDKNKNA